jgi:hypothetical protein
MRKLHHPVPKVGDTVRLNDFGLDMCFGNRGHSHMKTLEMKITEIDAESITAPEETFICEVDNVEINRLLLNHWCFDIVRPAAPGFVAPPSPRKNNHVLVMNPDGTATRMTFDELLNRDL